MIPPYGGIILEEDQCIHILLGVAIPEGFVLSHRF
jgi:hypothetical protein